MGWLRLAGTVVLAMYVLEYKIFVHFFQRSYSFSTIYFSYSCKCGQYNRVFCGFRVDRTYESEAEWEFPLALIGITQIVISAWFIPSVALIRWTARWALFVDIFPQSVKLSCSDSTSGVLLLKKLQHRKPVHQNKVIYPRYSADRRYRTDQGKWILPTVNHVRINVTYIYS